MSNVVVPGAKSLEKGPKGDQPRSTIERAGWCNTCTFAFMSGLIFAGARRPLEVEDVPELCDEDSSASVDRSFKKAIDIIAKKDPTVRALVRRSSGWTSVCIVVRAKGNRLWYGGVCLALWSMCYCLQPLFIKAILTQIKIKNRQDWTRGVSMSVTNGTQFETTIANATNVHLDDPIHDRDLLKGLSPLALWLLCLLTGLCQIFLLNHAFYNMFRFSFSARLGFMNQVWEKAIRLSSAGKLDPSMGNIQTLMAVDPARIMMGAIGVHWVWLGWVLIIASVGLMAVEIGWVALVPVACLLIIVIVQLIVVRKIGKTRRDVVQATDRRVQLTNEFLTGIRMLKMYAWESHAGTLVENARNEELSSLKRLLLLLQTNAVIFFIAPITIALATFTTYVQVYGEKDFDVSKCITVLGYMNLMRLPMALMPKCTGAFVDSLVSHRRIANFLFKGDEVRPRDKFGKILNGTLSLGTILLPANMNFFWKPNGHKRDLPTSIQTNNNSISIAKHSEERSAKREILSKDQWHLNTGAKGLTVPSGKLVCVMGQVGQGKTSLIAALLGEMKLDGDDGNKHTQNYLNGSVALVTQKAWIQNATVREAILFGSKYDKLKYDSVVSASQLQPDIRALPHGDQTEIGDRGLNLSGGQKQRVAIARAIYLKDEKDIFIFDDPLSACDVHVAGALWDEVICGEDSMLHGKTRIVVLNSHYHLLNSADMVVCLVNGKVEVFDSPGEAIACHPALGVGNEDDGAPEHTMENEVASDTIAVSTDTVKIVTEEVVSEEGVSQFAPRELRQRSISVASSTSSSLHSSAKARNLYDKENRTKGAVTIDTYIAWFDSAAANFSECCSCCCCNLLKTKRTTKDHQSRWAGVILLISVFFTFAACQAGRTLSDLALTWWSKTPSDRGAYILFLIISALTLGSILVRAFLFVYVSIGASQNFHKRIFKAVLDAPINLFFDITHVGEILNRFSSDLDHVDTLLPEFASQFFQNSLYCFAAIIICAWSSYYFLAMLVPLVFIYASVQTLFRKSSRELKRLEGVTRSPIFSAYQEALSGLDTIRAFDVKDRFSRANTKRTDLNTSLYLHYQMASRWLALRLDFLGVVTFCSVAAFALFLPLPEDQLPVVGLALVYALQITGLLQWTVRTFIETENNMTAVERLEYYRKKIPREKLEGFSSEHANDKNKGPPPEDWPQHGEIVIKNLWMRYRPGLPFVLRGVNMKIRSKEKIGVCGRTGSGKSSLIQALFRIVESEWSETTDCVENRDPDKVESKDSLSRSIIEIDGVNIAHVPLQQLRSKMSIIPQDPVLFTGTIRKNLDPFEKYDDKSLWHVLKLVELESFVRGLPNLLNHPVADGGENFSSGQRQLICFARALLRKTNIIVMDEATASVDSETDRKLQKMIRTRFKDQTVICIAHRLETILDCDCVCVLDKGKVVEYAPVDVLLNTKEGEPPSMFAGLVEEMRKHE